MGYDDWHRVVDVGGLEAVDGDVVFSGPDLDGEVLVGLLEDFERTVVRGLERGLLEFSSDENELGVAQAVGDAFLDASVDAGRDWSEAVDSFAELTEVLANWRLWSVLDEIAGYCQWRAVDQFCWRRVQVFLWSCSKAQEDPREFVDPVGSGQSGLERGLEGPVEPFDHTIGLGVVGRRWV